MFVSIFILLLSTFQTSGPSHGLLALIAFLSPLLIIKSPLGDFLGVNTLAPLKRFLSWVSAPSAGHLDITLSWSVHGSSPKPSVLPQECVSRPGLLWLLWHHSVLWGNACEPGAKSTWGCKLRQGSGENLRGFEIGKKSTPSSHPFPLQPKFCLTVSLVVCILFTRCQWALYVSGIWGFSVSHLRICAVPMGLGLWPTC